MGKIFYLFLIVTLLACKQNTPEPIDRKAMVDRNRVVSHVIDSISPAQVGNGEFAFNVDITGLQTFVPFNTLSNWSWHSFPLPKNLKAEDFKGVQIDTHGRTVTYCMANKEQPELSTWLKQNPHRFNLGRIGFVLLKSDGEEASAKDLQNIRQEVDMWKGIIYSTFELEGQKVEVETACHPNIDGIGVSVKSPLIEKGQIKIFTDFPYGDIENVYGDDYVGDYSKVGLHSSSLHIIDKQSAIIDRKMDDAAYSMYLNSSVPVEITKPRSEDSHKYTITPEKTSQFDFTCYFSKDTLSNTPNTKDVFDASEQAWEIYWKSGGAIDLSGSTDERWKELERRMILSQYLMKVNESGSLPPQESGLVNNGWYGRYHFEMIWWHGVHYAMWNRWEEVDKYLDIYKKFLPTSIERAKQQGYKGARWPKCTADFDREWPSGTHATLIWQQPHPIYFAEMDYRLHPTKETLNKWAEIVFESADFMADYVYYDKNRDEYMMGPPIRIVSENNDMMTTTNPIFELGYWRFGLRTAIEWKERLNEQKVEKWDDVLTKLAPLPIQDGVYVTYEGIDSMWTKYNWEHPGLTGVYGMLPGDGVNKEVFAKTFDTVLEKWNFGHVWGWDFPMMAMAAARLNKQEKAIDLLLTDSKNFSFDQHGLATGGPFPYFPSNGGYLTAIAMMAEGWDGSEGNAPGFPKNGKWIIRTENIEKLP